MTDNQEDINMNYKLGTVLVVGGAGLMVGGAVVIGCAAVGAPLLATATITTGAWYIVRQIRGQ